MGTNPPAATPTPTPPRRRWTHRAGRRVLIACALTAIAAGAGLAFLASETALELVLSTAVARSEGRLDIEEPRGSLLSTVRAKRIAWRGSEATLTADGVAFTWSPGALFSRGIVVRSLAAVNIALTVRPSDTATALPASLSLPTEVTIDRVAIERFEWTIGTSRGAIRGLAFGYGGGARAHRLRDLALAMERGTLAGEATLAADPPFAVTGSFRLAGDATLGDARAEVTMTGTLAAIVLDSRGSAGEARFTLQARVSPLAAVVLDTLALDAQDVDLARWDAALPATRLAVKADARPDGGGLVGRVEAENALPGRIDEQRVPLASAHARFAWTPGALTLDELGATLTGGGSATGRAKIPLDGGAGNWTLALAGIDLKRIYAPLVATHLSGTIAADLDARAQRIDGDIADRTIAGGVALKFAATVADGRLDIASFRARAGAGELAGSGGIDLDGARSFVVKATSSRLDPARFGEFPAGSLDGAIAASGALRPAWRVEGDARLAAGSRIAGLPVAGAARATLAARIARDVTVDVKLASSTLAVRGSVGEASSRLTAVLDAPRLAELAPLLPAPASRPLAGALRASVEGTLARHTVSATFADADVDVDASASGGLDATGATGGPARWRWTGTLETLENRGAWPLRLTAPVALEVARGEVKVGSARLAMADGQVDLAAFAWDEGRIATRGGFSRVPVATLARLAGVRMPLVSTLTLAGEWSLAATPRLNGSLTLRRDDGDLFLGEDSIVAPADRAFRITAIDLAARFRDDAVDATAALRSGRGVNADARLALGVAPGAAPGRIAADAPLSFALTAELATLKIVQPWVGTAAVVDGTARAELAGAGTVGQMELTGTLKGSGLRLDAAEYGLHFTDGRLAATLADGKLQLDELSLASGTGRFTASGTLAYVRDARRDSESATARIAWRADRFRVFNRPDLRLVASGAGTLAIAERRLTIEGKLRADEGHIDYTPDTRVALGDDVVVKGRPPRAKGGIGTEGSPLVLDLELDFGDQLTFTGEGLQTGLRGKLAVATAPNGALRGRGSISAQRGSYFAFGQRLTIDRGRLIFDGPLDNPGLDIVALRKNLAVEAGVAVTGTVKVPIIRLTSNPPVPDNEKLSWLVLGRGLDQTSGADIAALQSASAALLGGSGKPITATIAESVGIDDISVRNVAGTPRGATGAPETAGQAVAIGKRLTDKLSLVYEQGLTVATNALRLEYSLTRSLTLRAEAGVISGFGIYYRRTFE